MSALMIIGTCCYIPLLDALENMALSKPVWEDQPWPNVASWRGGDKAVDGRYTDRSYRGGQCVVSDNYKQTATWRVDLESVVSISHIDIYYRTDNLSRPSYFTSRIAGFFLYVSNTTAKEDGHLCFHEIQTVKGTPSEDQRINCSVHGRYVIYYNERRVGSMYPKYYSTYAYYELCELEVYGCSNVGYYGPNCSIPCPRNCLERRCDVNTGHCLGFVPGYQEPDCTQGQQECPMSSCDNNLVVISVVVSAVIVLTGSVLNYIYWKGKNAKTEKRIKQYMVLRGDGNINSYDELHTYYN